MDNKEVTLLVFLDLNAAFDTIKHSILLNVLERDFGVSGTALKWFDLFLSDCKQCVLISGKASDYFNLNCGVPQGSCLGPVLFTFYSMFPVFFYTPPLRPWLCRWYPALLLLSTYVPGILSWSYQSSGELYHWLVRSWFISNSLMINDIKAEFLIIGSRHQLTKMTIDSIVVGESSIKPSESVRNLGSWFDAQMRMNLHIGKTCSKAFHSLYKIRR